jgi:hypothetical protein
MAEGELGTADPCSFPVLTGGAGKCFSSVVRVGAGSFTTTAVVAIATAGPIITNLVVKSREAVRL